MLISTDSACDLGTKTKYICTQRSVLWHTNKILQIKEKYVKNWLVWSGTPR